MPNSISESHKSVKHLPRKDKLTGVYDRASFYRLAEDTIAAHPERCYDIVCSDIDEFSLLNDMLGHGAGDEVLRAAARALTGFAGKTGLCGRIGADVFCVLLERPEKYNEEMFRSLVSEVNSYLKNSRLNMSFGIYYCDNLDCSVNAACDRALAASYRRKGSFTQLYEIYDDSIRLKRLRDHALTEAMERALEEGQFVVYYQPNFNLQTGELAGAEALVRWDSPEEGLILPGEFIPVFEQNGLITKLDCFIWDRVCAFIKRCRDMGLPVVSMSVNVSRTDLFNTELPEIITAIVRKYGLEPGCLCLEITESAYTDKRETIIEAVKALSLAGFKIAMDDFGAGYSSLDMLSELPLNTLKLDMRLVQKSTTDVRGGVAGLAINLAKHLNLKVVAEGVETREQADRLREMNCDLAQGYFFCEPKPEQDFAALLLEGGKASRYSM